MPIYKEKNEAFFKKWSPEMAYVLGFFYADGCMFINPRGSKYIGFYSNDKVLLEEIRKTMDSTHKISERGIAKRRPNKSYILQIGSKEMFGDLKKLGLTPNKSGSIKFPAVPKIYLANFVRGYFDGDGSVACGYFMKDGKKRKSPILLIRFISGSEQFLVMLRGRLRKELHARGSIIYGGNAFRLSYSTNSSRKLFSFMYSKIPNNLFLERKYSIFLKDPNLNMDP